MLVVSENEKSWERGYLDRRGSGCWELRKALLPAVEVILALGFWIDPTMGSPWWPCLGQVDKAESL